MTKINNDYLLWTRALVNIKWTKEDNGIYFWQIISRNVNYEWTFWLDICDFDWTLIWRRVNFSENEIIQLFWYHTWDTIWIYERRPWWETVFMFNLYSGDFYPKQNFIIWNPRF